MTLGRTAITLMLALGLVAAAPVVPMLAPNAPPQIVSLSLSAKTVKAGGTISGSVIASSNVASVELRVVTYSYNMTKVAPGEFVASVRIPKIARVFPGTYALNVIARNTRGDETRASTSITIRR